MTCRRDNGRVRNGHPPSADGFLLLHAWLERENPDPLRVQVTAVPELEGVRVDTTTTASEAVAVECVREWLARFVASNTGPDAANPSGEVP